MVFLRNYHAPPTLGRVSCAPRRTGSTVFRRKPRTPDGEGRGRGGQVSSRVSTRGHEPAHRSARRWRKHRQLHRLRLRRRSRLPPSGLPCALAASVVSLATTLMSSSVICVSALLRVAISSTSTEAPLSTGARHSTTATRLESFGSNNLTACTGFSDGPIS